MRTTAGGVVLPGSVTSVDPPHYRCLLCGAQFKRHQGRAYEAHTARCADRHAEQIHALSPRTKAPGIFGDSGWDKEEEAHYRRGGT